jgi:hypothetical protein
MDYNPRCTVSLSWLVRSKKRISRKLYRLSTTESCSIYVSPAEATKLFAKLIQESAHIPFSSIRSCAGIARARLQTYLGETEENFGQETHSEAPSFQKNKSASYLQLFAFPSWNVLRSNHHGHSARKPFLRRNSTLSRCTRRHA